MTRHATRRRSPASWAAPRPRSRRVPRRSFSSPRTSSRRASRRLRSGSACARRRAPGSSEVSIRTTPAPAPNGRWSCCAASPAPQPAPGAIDVYPRPIEAARIRVRTERVNQLLDTALDDTDIAAYLTPLAIEVRDGIAVVPTFRPDLTREIDLVEEVARRIGLDHIARTVPSNPEKIGGLSPRRARSSYRDRRARRRRLRRDLHVAARCARRPCTGRRRRRGSDRSREPFAVGGVDPAARTGAGRAARRRVQRRPRRTGRRTLRDRHGVRHTAGRRPPPRGAFSSRVRAHAHDPARAARTRPSGRRVRRDRGAVRIARRAPHRRRAAGRGNHRGIPPGAGGPHPRRGHAGRTPR